MPHDSKTTAAVPPLTDTHPDADRVQIELLRRCSVAKRVGLTRSLSTTAIQLARRAIARSNPDLSPRELDLLFVDIHYGPELANRLRAYLADEGRAL